ncbi:hypothetical protein, partial [Bartonella tribocorum]|uniref:hypothetical protein n=1 Tax=Bartonella tribocorum TaxID=85701 RepID=UPI001ABA902B
MEEEGGVKRGGIGWHVWAALRLLRVRVGARGWWRGLLRVCVEACKGKWGGVGEGCVGGGVLAEGGGGDCRGGGRGEEGGGESSGG